MNKNTLIFSPISSPRITSALPQKHKGISANRSSSYLLRPSSTTNYRTDIFEGVPNDGTIIVHPTRITNAQTYLSAKGWNIVEATEYKE